MSISGNMLHRVARQQFRCSRRLVARAQVSGHLPPRPAAGWPDDLLPTLLDGLRARIADSRRASNANLEKRWSHARRYVWVKSDDPLPRDYVIIKESEMPPLPDLPL